MLFLNLKILDQELITKIVIKRVPGITNIVMDEETKMKRRSASLGQPSNVDHKTLSNDALATDTSPEHHKYISDCTIECGNLILKPGRQLFTDTMPYKVTQKILLASPKHLNTDRRRSISRQIFSLLFCRYYY